MALPLAPSVDPSLSCVPSTDRDEGAGECMSGRVIAEEEDVHVLRPLFICMRPVLVNRDPSRVTDVRERVSSCFRASETRLVVVPATPHDDRH